MLEDGIQNWLQYSIYEGVTGLDINNFPNMTEWLNSSAAQFNRDQFQLMRKNGKTMLFSSIISLIGPLLKVKSCLEGIKSLTGIVETGIAKLVRSLMYFGTAAIIVIDVLRILNYFLDDLETRCDIFLLLYLFFALVYNFYSASLVYYLVFETKLFPKQDTSKYFNFFGGIFIVIGIGIGLSAFTKDSFSKKDQNGYHHFHEGKLYWVVGLMTVGVMFLMIASCWSCCSRDKFCCFKSDKNKRDQSWIDQSMIDDLMASNINV
jgi:hypothetical protein